jgi:2-methylcitrate dehydratase PrpD
MDQLTELLVEYALTLSYEDLPPEVVERTKCLILEFIPIKSLAATESAGPGSCAGHSTVPSRDHARPLSTSGSGL